MLRPLLLDGGFVFLTQIHSFIIIVPSAIVAAAAAAIEMPWRCLSC
jgi:hypothetical protein